MRTKFLVVGFLFTFTLIFLGGVNAHSGSWYLDNTATGANNGTSWANAWKGMSDVTWGPGGVQGGDTLYISGGSSSQTYTATGENYLSPGDGTDNLNRVTIKTGQDAGHNGKVIIDGNNTYSRLLDLTHAQYITVDGSYNGLINMFIQNSPPVTSSYANMVEITGLRNVTLKYLEIKNGPDGIGGEGAVGLEISNCDIHNITNDHLISILTNGVTHPGSDYADKLVHDNVLEVRTAVKGAPYNTTCGPDAIQMSGWGSVYNNSFNVIKGATDVSQCQHPDYFQIPGTAVKVKVYNNIFNSSPALSIIMEGQGWTTPNNIYIYNNVFNGEGTADQSVLVQWSADVSSVDNFHFDNNTLVDIHGYNGIRFTKSLGTSYTNSTVKNNIFYNIGNGSWQPIYMEGFTASDADALNIANNLVNAGATGSVGVVRNEGAGSVPYASSNLVSTAPAFVYYTVNGVNNNYHLAADDTSAIDAGSTLTAFSDDKDGVSRPKGVAWDIGAYEYRMMPKGPPNFGLSKPPPQ